jgi:hypothetical protein
VPCARRGRPAAPGRPPGFRRRGQHRAGRAHEFDAGLEQLHASLFDLEHALPDAALGATAIYRKEYRETVLDEDRMDA